MMMKKGFFSPVMFISAVLLVLGSCSCQGKRHQGLSSPSRELSFCVPGLRVTDDLWEEGDRIGIFAFNRGETFDSGTPRHKNRSYSTDQGGEVGIFYAETPSEAIILSEGESLDFFAYYPYDANVGSDNTIILSADEEVPFPSLLYSDDAKNISLKNAADSRVLLHFRHATSCLRIRLLDEASNPLHSAQVSLQGARLSGEFSLASGKFSSQGPRGEVMLSYNRDGFYASNLVPDQLEDDSSLKIGYDGKKYELPMPSDMRLLEPGKRYDLTVVLRNQGGEVSLSLVGGTIVNRDEGESFEATLTPDEQGGADPSLPSKENNYLNENIQNGDPERLELPRPTGGAHNYLVTHKVNGDVNYTVEFDTELRTPRFVAFTFDRNNSPKNVSRSDAWGWDPLIPSRYATDRDDFDGYSRGHLVASNDRTASEAANRQTFYYSNMALQNQDHNSGIWNSIENRVQNWARSEGMASGDKILYVAKGITCDDVVGKDFVLAHGKTGIPVAKYFWMAVIYSDGENYYGIAFLTEQTRPKKNGSLRNYAMSINELEEFIGKDLFYNFSDDKEEAVEIQEPTDYLHIWSGI